MCLAIPGQILEVVDEPNRLARVDVAGVQRTINIGLLDDVGPGDWVLIHVGFAISQVDEEEARATRSLLERMGADYEQELRELRASVIETRVATESDLQTLADGANTRSSRATGFALIGQTFLVRHGCSSVLRVRPVRAARGAAYREGRARLAGSGCGRVRARRRHEGR